MSANYGSAVFGGIGEQHAGANGAVSQQLPPSIGGTFALKGGRRSRRAQNKKRRSGKSYKKQSKQRQQKGGK